MAIKLLENQAGTPGGTYNSNSAINPDPSQRTFFVWGTWGEANVRIEYSPDGNKWLKDPTGESSFNEDAVRTIKFAAGVHFRAVIVGATGSTSLNVWVF